MTCAMCRKRGTSPDTCSYEFCAPKARGHSISHSMAFGKSVATLTCLDHLVWLELDQVRGVAQVANVFYYYLLH